MFFRQYSGNSIDMILISCDNRIPRRVTMNRRFGIILFLTLSFLLAGMSVPAAFADVVQTDVVVIGAGSTGLAAAVTAAEGGARVILFEKQPFAGGSSNFFSGIFAVESAMQREQYIDYTRDEAFRNIMDYSHWRANPRLVRAFVDESAKTIDWLKGLGVEFTNVTINLFGGPRTYHEMKGLGAAVIKAMKERAQKLGVDLRLSTAVTKLIRKDGKISGVVAEKDGKIIEVSAKAVVVATGGYVNNAEWIRKYTGFESGVDVFPVASKGKVGDGIRMAWEVGAAEEGIGVLELFRTGPIGPGYKFMGHMELVTAQPLLWVDYKGERFCDESIGFIETSVGNASVKQRKGYTYTVFDDSIKERLIEKGIDKGIGQANPPGTRPVDFEKEFSAAVKRGSTDVFAADSLEELARKAGMDAKVFTATVEEYNRFCRKQHDDLFAKDPKYLWPLTGPKYYAIKARAIAMGTLGGIKINDKMEALDKEGEVIPGLYAGGFDAGGMYGDSYSIKDSSGASSAFAINSGRIAGRNTLKYMGK